MRRFWTEIGDGHLGSTLAAGLAVIALVACRPADDRPSVVLYVSADEYVAREVIAAFEAETAIRVDFVGDTEAKKTTGLVERLRAERDHPQADVFWSSEVFMTIELAEEGVLEAHESEATAAWPREHRDPDGRWFGFAARARVIAFAPQRVAPEERPTTWMELTDHRWRGRLAMADPRFGTTGGHLGAMKAHWDRRMPGFYEAFLMGLSDNEMRVLPSGNAGVVEMVVSGEVDLGMTDTDNVWAARGRGAEVELIYPAHDVEPSARGAGTLLIPNTVALVRGAPHPVEAATLVDFLLSARVERMLADSVSHNVPLGRDRDAPEGVAAVPDPLAVDLLAAAAQRSAAVDMAVRRLMGRADADRDDDAR